MVNFKELGFTDYFEEFRFVLQILLAEFVFTFNCDQRKIHFKYKLVGGIVFLMFLSMGYFYILEFYKTMSEYIGADIAQFIIPLWYGILFVCSLFYISRLFKINYTELVFKGVLSYSLYNAVYSVFNQAIAIGIWPSLRNDTILMSVIYFLITLFGTLLIYSFVYFYYRNLLKEGMEASIPNNSSRNKIFYTIFIVIVFLSAFAFQSLFYNGNSDGLNGYNYVSVFENVLTCILILIVGYANLRLDLVSKKKAIAETLLYSSSKQYRVSKENIDIINRKCHDLKHQIRALKLMNEEEKKQSLNELESNIDIYDNTLKTNNEVLNTIINEKMLLCKSKNITLTLIIDDTDFSMLSTLEMYNLFGNILDNSIEAVNKISDTSKRVISLNISTKANFLSIQTNNFYANDIVKDKRGKIITSKGDKINHGYGLQSIEYIVNRHHGNMKIKKNKNIFILSILIPKR
ncbi:MAG: ATP-binding protein [Bacilli bacterium]|nr:ATP-binding protein [Bacilli bacterium]